MKIQKIKIQEKHKPIICLLSQIVMVIGLAFFCFGIAVIAKDYGLQHLFLDTNWSVDTKYMEAIGGCIIASSLMIVTNSYMVYKMTYGWSEEDMEGAHLKSVRFGHFDKETLLKNKENILDFKKKQIKKEEEMSEKEIQFIKKSKELSKLKLQETNAIEQTPKENKNGSIKNKTISKIFER